uniref:Uncharacterized protein n=1 Tax=Acrobeloides nanus TaxID=290746 RepID=A0A914DWV4_9BILA
MICVTYPLDAQRMSISAITKWQRSEKHNLSSEKNNFWEYLTSVKKPPKGSNNGPLKVHIGLYIESLGNFQEKKMSFDVDLYLYMSWLDPQLKHKGREMLMINDDKIRKKLWLPDLYFANARSAYFHDVTVPNFNLFLGPDGTVSYSSRVTLTVACNLDLVNYPMDYQSCSIRVLSYAYIASVVNVTWFTINPISYNSEIDLPEFSITHVKAEYCNGTYRYAITENSFKQDKFSCLESTLYLKRALGYNMVQTYVPTGMIVMISWVSFWIDRRAVPARVTLSFTTLVSLTTLGNGMRYALPQVSYAKAIDYWFGACMLFVFLALLEFALVNSFMRKSEKYEKLSNKYGTKKDEPQIVHKPQEMSQMWGKPFGYVNPHVYSNDDEEIDQNGQDKEVSKLLGNSAQSRRNVSSKVASSA